MIVLATLGAVCVGVVTGWQTKKTGAEGSSWAWTNTKA